METLVTEPQNEFLTETKQSKQEDWRLNDVQVIILLNRTPIQGILKPYEVNICGKKMFEWVQLACDELPVKTCSCTLESDVLALIKPLLGKAKTTVVLYSDTPLFSNDILLEILEYFVSHEMNVLKLPRGFVFNTDYIKEQNEIITNIVMFENRQEFFVCDGHEKISKVRNIIQERILSFHEANGVVLMGKRTTFIDADVIIESGSVLEPNVYISGQTFIGKNCHIGFGSRIIDSIISENTRIISSHVECSRVSENMVVGPYESVIKKSV